ncbi:MAG: hypothetical protein KAS04_00865, partial [Candidatus Aenigmarchaeota archaeon]|nr:hypothetical protein [Candidatus Aenigmarchaeota archaeon]
MASKTKTGIPETKGFFQLKGKVVGVGKENFYKEGKTRAGNPYRRISFGVQVSKNETFFVEIFGNIMENVYFSKRNEDKTFTTKAVAWKDRKKFNKKDYSLIGMNLGLTKKEDSKGKAVNDKQYMVDFDGCEHINENLKDGMSVFVKGKIQYGHYSDDSGELKRTQKFIP